jgi:hypothetical protein
MLHEGNVCGIWWLIWVILRKLVFILLSLPLVELSLPVVDDDFTPNEN